MAFMNVNKRLLAVLEGVIVIFFPGALVFGYPGHYESLLALGIFTFIEGKLQEKMGTRVMVTIGSVICGVAVVIAAFSTNIYMNYL